MPEERQKKGRKSFDSVPDQLGKIQRTLNYFLENKQTGISMERYLESILPHALNVV